MSLLARSQLRSATAASRQTVASRPSLPARCKRSVVVAASETPSSETDVAAQFQETLSKTTKVVKEKWDATEDQEKPAAIAIIVGVVVAQIAIGATIDALDHIPLLKQFLELVGIVFTGYTGYNLLVNPSERTKLKGAFSSFVDSVVGK